MEQWIDFQQSLAQRLPHADLDQTQTKAKNFGLQGHALVRGVAGSGKSLVLRNRVEKLVADGLENILVLSYNRFMHQWLNHHAAQYGSKVECRTFHAWAGRTLNYNYEWDRDEEARKQVIVNSEKSRLNYQAILVDEAQDFYDEWFAALLNVLATETYSLFFAYDNTQSIYGQPHRRKANWTWKSLGIEVTGRSQIFDLNYRNAPEILELAWKFILPALAQADMKVEKRGESSIGTIVEPRTQRSRSSGLAPQLVQVAADLPITIVQQIRLALQSHAESSIGILVPPDAGELRKAISRELSLAEILHHAPQFSRDRAGNVVDRPYVIVDSWNALKGVEFDAVVVVGADQVVELDDPDQNFQAKAGLYTAMTRARDHLVLLYGEKNSTIEQLEAALNAPPQLEQEG